MEARKKLRCVVIGFGYWGPHLVRNIRNCEDIELVAIADREESRRNKAFEIYPKVEITESVDLALSLGSIDIAVIATPAASHFDIAMKCLNAGCHLLVEKPLSTSYQKANTLVVEAEKRGLTLMVDHTFLYSSAVDRMRKLVKTGELGALVYFDSQRVNLGLFQPDVNVLWDLAVHDLSILFDLVDEMPISVSAIGGAHKNSNFEAAMFLTLKYSSNFFAHINVSWLSPMKIRRTVLSGSSKTVLFDDMESDARIKVFDAGVDEINLDENALLNYRLGDVQIPRLQQTEPLKEEINHFVSCIKNNEEPLSSGRRSLPIIKVLESATLSSSLAGQSVDIDWGKKP